jgi:hypothetical protein
VLDCLTDRHYEFNMSPETPPNRHPVTLHTSTSVVKVDRDY